MAIISDGTTDITIEFVDEDINPAIEETIKRTAGGNLRKITGGERLGLNLELRVTPSQYRSVLSLLTNNADNYFYTPEESTASYWSSLYPDLEFPLNITYTNLKRTWDNRGYWYIKMDAEFTNYI